ncbi:MAG: hypothetical protein WAR39_11890 [Prevotella sp.]
MMKKIIYSLLTVTIAALSFTSCEDVPAPYAYPDDNTGGEVVTTEPAGSGTKEDPYNVAAAMAKIKALDATGQTAPMYVKGKVVSIKSIDTATYGNASYYISDDGTANGQLYIFQSFYLDKVKFTSDTQIKVGDEVIIYGPFVNYQGNTPETAGKGASYLYSLNGKTSDSGTTVAPAGSGTQADPYNVAGALAKIKVLDSTQQTAPIYVKGKIVSVKSIDTTTYGNANYYISDDGTANGQLYIFQSFYLNNVKFASDTQIKAGDEVVIYGPFVNFKGNTPETAGKGASYLYSLNGETSGTGTPPASGAITVSGTTVTLSNAAATAGETTVAIDLNTLGLANATAAPVVTLSDGSTITFGKGTNTTNGPMFYTATKGIRLYANNTMEFDCKQNIAKIVFTCDSFSGTDYVGNTTQTVSFDAKKATYTNTYAQASGGVQLRVKTVTITYSK